MPLMAHYEIVAPRLTWIEDLLRIKASGKSDIHLEGLRVVRRHLALSSNNYLEALRLCLCQYLHSCYFAYSRWPISILETLKILSKN